MTVENPLVIDSGQYVFIRLTDKDSKGKNKFLLGSIAEAFDVNYDFFFAFIELGGSKTVWFPAKRIYTLEILTGEEVEKVLENTKYPPFLKYKQLYFRDDFDDFLSSLNGES
jgi:hypothetical protein